MHRSAQTPLVVCLLWIASVGGGEAAELTLDAAAAVVAALDERGAWLDSGRLKSSDKQAAPEPIIESQRFVRNIEILARYVGAR